MKRRAPICLAIGTAGVLVLSPTASARADEPAAAAVSETCEASFETADLRLRPSESRLLEARAALRECSRPNCKPWMIDDCSKRRAEVEGRIPSVALSAEDGRGVALYDVRILDGGHELVPSLNGLAVEMDPGPHELIAEHDGQRVGRTVVLIEGRKAQQVVFTFPIASDNASSPRPNGERVAPPLAHPWARPFAAGLLAGAVVATGTGVVLGLVAYGRKQDARCDGNNVCDAEPLNDARSAARSANVAIGLGAALAVGSVITFFAFGWKRVDASASLNHVQLSTNW